MRERFRREGLRRSGVSGRAVLRRSTALARGRIGAEGFWCADVSGQAVLWRGAFREREGAVRLGFGELAILCLSGHFVMRKRWGGRELLIDGMAL